MKIRTALVLACFLLSVLPLGVIVIYSYYASRRALESAYHAEAARLTAQMDRRLGNIRDVLEQRLAEVSALPNLSNADKEKAPVVGNILMTMGDAASQRESLRRSRAADRHRHSSGAEDPTIHFLRRTALEVEADFRYRLRA